MPNLEDNKESTGLEAGGGSTDPREIHQIFPFLQVC